MDTRKIIEAVGGRKEVMAMTGLTRGRIYQWMDEESIPTPWLKFFQAKFPKLDWPALLGSELDRDAVPKRRKEGQSNVSH